MPKKVLFVFAHMDDETINSYGTIRKFLKCGIDVSIYCLCGNGRNRENDEHRRKIFDSLMSNQQGGLTHRLCCFDLNLIERDINDSVARMIEDENPDVVVTHSIHDLHSEHRMVAEQMLVLCRNKSDSNVKSLYFSAGPQSEWTYGVYGKFQPNTFIDISEFRDDKISALRSYGNIIPSNDFDLRSTDSIIQWNDMWGRVAGQKSSEPYELVFSRV